MANHWNTADSGFLQTVDGPQLARLTLTGAATVTYGARATLQARLTDQVTDAGVQGGSVNLFGRQVDEDNEQAAGSTVGAADGSGSFTVTPAASTLYRASFPSSEAYGPANSAQVRVSVRPRVTARAKATTVTYGKTLTVTGSVAPNHHGQRVYLQRLVGGVWKTAATATLGATSAYSVSARPTTKGRLAYRVWKGDDADHASGASPTLTVTVR